MVVCVLLLLLLLIYHHNLFLIYCHLAFSALMLLVGWQEGQSACKKIEWWDSGMVICLGRGADLHVAQLMPLSLVVVVVVVVVSLISGN